jgi:hypothetical protein
MIGTGPIATHKSWHSVNLLVCNVKSKSRKSGMELTEVEQTEVIDEVFFSEHVDLYMVKG